MFLASEIAEQELSPDALSRVLDAVLPDAAQMRGIAIGVSGGPDSMALCMLLASLHQAGKVPPVHAITVDHGLRAEAAAEAASVGAWLRDVPGVSHTVLTREKPQSDTRILESARDDRYALLSAYCREHGITHLFLAHHMDDQAETFLFRLSKGSGLNGLAGMAPVYEAADIGLTLVRPLLFWPKAALIEYCAAHKVPFVNDPSNVNADYARPRLRAVSDALAREGLTPALLSRTAFRLARVKDALEFATDKAWHDAQKPDEDGLSFDMGLLRGYPDEIILRVLLRALEHFDEKGGYGPRLDRVEALCTRILQEPGFTRATLSGCLISLNSKSGTLRVERESEKA